MPDLVVVGGGPIGLAVALHAHRAGLEVVVREPRSGALDKACGEGLMPAAIEELAGLGISPVGRAFRGIRYHDADHVAEAPFRGSPGRGVRRTTLHAAMAEAIADADIPVVHEAVTWVSDADEHVRVDGEPVGHVVAADGLHSPVRRMLGLDEPAPSGRAPRYGLRRHYTLAPWSDFVEVFWAATAEAYVTPVAEDQVVVALLGPAGRGFEETLTQFPELVEHLGSAEATRVRGAGPLRQVSSRRTSGRVLLAGDAAGYVDALTGEGLALGLAQARAAVEAIVQGDVESYESAWRRINRRHDTLTKTLLAAGARPAVRRRIVPLAARMPGVFGVIVNNLARPA